MDEEVPPELHEPTDSPEFAETVEPMELEYDLVEEDVRSRDDELNALRIRQISTGRRADVRARTYLFVGSFASAVGCVKLVLMAVDRVRVEHHWGWPAVGFIFLASMISMLSRMFWRRAGDITRELAKPLQHDPVTPPDFTGLSDGTQVAKDLEEMR